MRLALALFSFLALIPVALSQTKPRPMVSDSSVDNVATFTIQVTSAPTRAEARAAAKGRPEIMLVNSKPLMRLTEEFSNQSVEAPQGTLILLHASPQSGAVGFTISPPGILEPPPGVYHLPKNVIGILHAAKLGTAVVSMKGFPARATFGSVFNDRTTTNWSGYAIDGGPFTSASAAWTVPYVFSNGGDASATWVGIDGDSSANPTLIQVGTHQNYSHGFLGFGVGPEYYAWYEVLPEPEQRLPNPVAPGDHMLAIVSLSGDLQPGSPMSWLIFLMNQTQNWTATQTVTYPGALTSAEWIVEAPTACPSLGSCHIQQLANYNSVTFDAFDFVNSNSPAFTSDERILLLQGTNTVSVPSDPDGDRDGFTVAYGDQKPAPPGPMITTTSLPQGFSNISYRAFLTATCACSLQWSAVNLPSWLSLDQNTGILSGVPPADGVYPFSVIARDATNQHVSSQIQPLVLSVGGTPPPPDFSLSAAPVTVFLSASSSGCTGSTTIAVNPLFGFSSTVFLAASGSGVTGAQFNPSVTQTSSQLTLHSNLCGVSSDPHLVTITGTFGSLKHSVVINLVPLNVTGPCSTIEGHNRVKFCNP